MASLQSLKKILKKKSSFQRACQSVLRMNGAYMIPWFSKNETLWSEINVGSYHDKFEKFTSLIGHILNNQIFLSQTKKHLKISFDPYLTLHLVSKKNREFTNFFLSLSNFTTYFKSSNRKEKRELFSKITDTFRCSP